MSQVIISSDDMSRVDKGLKALKRKIQREGIPKELRIRKHAEKPSEKKRRKQKDAARRKNKFRRRFGQE